MSTNCIWSCDQCGTTYGTEGEASRCEDRHKKSKARTEAYKTSLANGKKLIGRYREEKDGSFALGAVYLILRRDEAHTRYQQDEARYEMTDAYQCFNDFLPDINSKYIGYLSIAEAVTAGWCPFFSQHYQSTWPLAIREQVADAFLSLPGEVQATHLLAKMAMTRHCVEH